MAFRAVAGPGPPRCSRCTSPPLGLDRRTSTLVVFAPPSERSGGRRPPLSRWPPLSRFVRRCPSVEVTSARPLPGASSLRARRATAVPCSAFVVSRHLDGLLRAPGRGLVASHSRPGVQRVSRSPYSEASEDAPMLEQPSPRCGSNPPKSLPRQQPHRVTTAVAPLPLPLAQPTSRRFSTDESLAPGAVADSPNARSFHGLCFPSKVSPTSPRRHPRAPATSPRQFAGSPVPEGRDETTLARSVRSRRSCSRWLPVSAPARHPRATG